MLEGIKSNRGVVWFLALGSATKLILVGAAILLVVIVVLAVSESARGWIFRRGDEKFDNADTERVETYEEAKARADREKQRADDAEKRAAEANAKYELAKRAVEIEHGKGEELDAALEKSLENLEQERNSVDPALVTDDELVRILDAHDARTRSKSRRTQ